MKYQVNVQGQTLDIHVHQGPDGYEVQVGDGPRRTARLVGCPAPLHALELGSERVLVALDADPLDEAAVRVALPGHAAQSVTAVDARALAAGRGPGAGGKKAKKVKSPMPGLILELRVEVGQEVKAGEVLLILEAMKMQNELRAEADGTVKAIKASVGASVAAGALLIEFA